MDRLFSPEVVAVVGASRSEASLGGKAFRFTAANNGGAKVYPVNPVASEIDGHTAYPSLSAIPEDRLDVVYVVAPASTVPQILAETRTRDVGFLVVASSGFAESGNRELEASLTRDSGTSTRVVGPNCNGLWNGHAGLCMGFNAAHALSLTSSSISIVAQSGAMLGTAVRLLHEYGSGIGLAISTGNEADLHLVDYLDYLVDDPGTRVIGLMVDSISEVPAFAEGIRKAHEARKPVIALRFGRSERGRQAAELHSARMSSEAAALDSWLDKAGVAWTNDFDGFVMALALTERCLREGALPAPCERGPVGMSTSGAGAAMLADLLEAADVSLRDFPAGIQSRLEGLMTFGTPANPLDLTGEAVNRDWLRQVFDIAINQSGMSPGVLLLSVLPTSAEGDPLLGTVLRDMPEKRAPVLAYAPALLSELEYERFREAGALVTRSGHGMAVGLATTLRAQSIDRRLAAAWIQDIGVWLRRRAVREGRTSVLLHDECESALSEYGIAFPRSVVTRDASDDVLAPVMSSTAGVALKLLDPGAIHKASGGALRLGLRTSDDVRTAISQISGSGLTGPESRFLVQEMVAGVYEMFLGVVVDPSLGPMLLLGVGGSAVEQQRRFTSIALPPGIGEVRQRLAGLGIEAELASYLPPEAVAHSCESVDQLVAGLWRFLSEATVEVVSLDLNPVTVLPNGRLVAVDARMATAGVVASDAMGARQ